jgi:hypothetical protein
MREALIDRIVETIDREGKHGEELRHIIARTLEDERFRALADTLIENIVRKADIGEKESRRLLSMLMEEDVADEIMRGMEYEAEETEDPGHRVDRHQLDRLGRLKRLWTRAPRRYLGGRASLIADVVCILRRNAPVKVTFVTGFVLLVISAVLFGSPYLAMLTGFTLTAVPAETTAERVANIVGALGGILLFFLTVSLVFQYLLISKGRDEKVRERASRYLRKRRGDQRLEEKGRGGAGSNGH